MTVELSEEQYQRLHDDIKQEVIGEVKEEIADELQSSNEVEVRSDGDNAGLGDIWIAGNPIGTLLDKALQNSSDAKKTAEQARATQSAEDNPKGKDGDTGSSDGMLPIERMIKIREKDKDHPALPKNGKESFDRSVVIFQNFQKWSKKASKGRTITSGLKELLGAVTGTRLAWRQVYRAMDKVEEWTNGVITHEQTRRHGHVLVMSEQSSSAVGG